MTVADVDGVLARYAELVRACPHNLLSPRGLDELESRHIPESVAFARELPEDVNLIDVGPGGGLPGMVIAVVRPDIRVTMVEATRKKADFLRDTGAELGVDVEVQHGRIEELGREELAGRFDVATARAVAALDTLVGWVLPVLRPGGALWAIKGDRWAEELAAARPQIARAGGEVVRTPDDPSTAATPSAPLRPTVVIIGRARGTANA